MGGWGINMTHTNIPVLVFEDRVLSHQDEFTKLMPMPHPETIKEDVKLSFCWHPVWNHLGQMYAKDMGIQTRNIEGKSIYEESISFCMDTKLDGAVAVVDMQFAKEGLPLSISTEKVPNEFWDFYRQIDPDIVDPAGKNDIAKGCSSVSSNNRHGLVLAFCLIINADVKNVDVWLASGVAETARCAETLYKFAETKTRNVRVFNAGGSCSRDGAEVTTKRFRTAFCTFADRYRGLDQILWPEYAKDWFSRAPKQEAGLLPHHFEDIGGKLEGGKYNCVSKETYKATISVYLKQLTGRSNVPSTWYDDKGLHETLKRLVGGDAVSHVGNGQMSELKLPSLGVIALLAAAAENLKSCLPDPHNDWFQKFSFRDSAVAPLLPAPCTRDEAREAIAALYAFLWQLLPAKGGTSILTADWENRGGLDRLFLDFSFDCLKPDDGKTDALLEKLTNMRWWHAGGSTTDKYRTFRDKFKLGEQCKLAVSVYPVTSHKTPATRFEFRPL